jgi:hypothetical protein
MMKQALLANMGMKILAFGLEVNKAQRCRSVCLSRQSRIKNIVRKRILKSCFSKGGMLLSQDREASKAICSNIFMKE